MDDLIADLAQAETENSPSIVAAVKAALEKAPAAPEPVAPEPSEEG